MFCSNGEKEANEYAVNTEETKKTSSKGCLGCLTIIGILIIFSLIFSNDEDKQKKHVKNPIKATTVEQTKKAASDENELETETIANVVGLGDTFDSFVSFFGDYNDDGTFTKFNNGKVLVYFDNGIANSITINQDNVDIDSAKTIAKDYMPDDAVISKEEKLNDGTYKKLVAYCKSEKISKFDNEKIKVLSMGSDKKLNKMLVDDFLKNKAGGKFVVIHKIDLSGNVFATIIGLGHKP